MGGVQYPVSVRLLEPANPLRSNVRDGELQSCRQQTEIDGGATIPQ